jgi:hypothetical protein
MGKITGAPWCLGTIPNTRDVLYIPQGMHELYIPSRHEWGYVYLRYDVFLTYISRVCKSTYIYM